MSRRASAGCLFSVHHSAWLHLCYCPQAQRFLALVLLPAVRNDIRENHRLHFALFQALKKATYKVGCSHMPWELSLSGA